MLFRAFAKINLDLRILGARADGYHEVRTILQTIDWSDELRIEPAAAFEFSATEGPEDETNLVVRAVRAYERIARIRADVRICLLKNVPAGRGLGGGSADAAVTFMGLQRLFKRYLPVSEVSHALRVLGSDVPFFAIGGRAIGTGRGDEVRALDDAANYALLLVDPGFPITTKDAYSWLTLPDKSNTIGGFRPEPAFDRETGSGNDFEAPVFRRYPVLAGIRDGLLKLGAFRAALSGSGSAMFGQFHTESEAARAASELNGLYSVRVTKPLPGSEYFQRMVEE